MQQISKKPNFSLVTSTKSQTLSRSINSRFSTLSKGFTIVELLVVIVVIGILASITMVAYTGITQKATAATLQSDLKNASTLLEMDKTIAGTYPATKEAANGGNGLNPSPGTDLTYTHTGNTDDYSLVASKGNTSYFITSPGKTPTVGTILDATLIIDIEIASGQIADDKATNGTYSPTKEVANGGKGLQPSPGVDLTYTFDDPIGGYTLIASKDGKSYSITSEDPRPVAGTVPEIPASLAVTDPANWLAVGTQVWAKANLNVGTIVAGATEQTNNGGTNIVEKYCYGDTDAGCTNTDSNGTTYGGLYQWNEAMKYVTTEGAQGICPAGSHIPTDNEWKILEMSLSGMSQATADTEGLRGTDEGTKLKSGGSSGLNMPLAGFRYSDGSFLGLSSYAYLWSSSESGGNAWGRYLGSGYATVSRGTGDKAFGFSVRCLGN